MQSPGVLLSVAALTVVLETLTFTADVYAQAADSVSIGTAELILGKTRKEISVEVRNLTVGAGDQGWVPLLRAIMVDIPVILETPLPASGLAADFGN